MKFAEMPPYVIDHIRGQNLERKLLKASVYSALADRDLSGLINLLCKSTERGLAGLAMKHIAAYPGQLGTEMHPFMAWWQSEGDSVRGELNDDLALLGVFWKLCPVYQGPSLTLYRGDSWFNRCRRTYGMSWTSSEDVARGFANGFWRRFQGGSVLLQATVPKNAIVAQVHHDDDGYEEFEFLVDRRKLAAVHVLERFKEISEAEFSNLQLERTENVGSDHA